MLITKLISLLFMLIAPCVSVALNIMPSDSFKTVEEILSEKNITQDTKCASEIFTKALIDKSNEISEINTEAEVETWAKIVMQSPEVLNQVLQCPEITSVSENTTITFSPVVYQFENGRTITINYSSTPQILKHHILLATKPKLQNSSVNPDLMNPNNTDLYTNTEPAWYAIMVVQHDALSEFVGPDKNNTVSVKWIDENIKKIYPKGYYCTSKSALANDSDTINRVVHDVVKIDDDSNDYYVAGDVNLGWIMYAEIAADVIITAVTFGGGAVATGALKSLRSTKAAKSLIKSTKALTKLDDVSDYLKVLRKVSGHTDDIAKLEKNIKNAEKYEKALSNAEKARKAGKIKDIEKYEKEARELLEAAKKIDPKTTADTLRNADRLKDQQKNLKNELKILNKEADDMVKTSENIAKYKENSEALEDLMKYRRELQSIHRPRGNVFVRTLNSFAKAQTGNKKIDRASRAARAGMSGRSAKIKDWMFHTTLKAGARLTKFEEMGGLLYGAISFLGDMYDHTSTTSKEFSNGIEFKPLCLLSADDIKGQENVINYGMWLMWHGNSTDPADDDAAYLQSMDFAAKFFYLLDEYQDEHGANCNVDIYVVRPIIKLNEKNQESSNGELFWLFMNEIPWSTNHQFKSQIHDISAWETMQNQLDQQDPENKYAKKDTPVEQNDVNQPATEPTE